MTEMKKIISKFRSTCSASGQVINKGESIWYDVASKKVYKDGNEPQVSQDALHVQANEEAYFENWYARNY
jgi:hypothetical protein